MEIFKKYQNFILANMILFGISACSFSITGTEIKYLPSEYPIISFAFASISLTLAILLSKLGNKKVIIALTIFVLLLPFSFVVFHGIKWMYIGFLSIFAVGFLLIGIINLNRFRLHKIQ